MATSSFPRSGPRQSHILFLTAETSKEGNKKLLQDPPALTLLQKGIRVSARSILEWDQPLNLEEYSHVLLLRVWDYNLYLSRFFSMIVDLQALNGRVQTLNPLPVVKWNVDKSLYLPELQDVGIPIIETAYIPLPASRAAIHQALQTRKNHNPVVLKPSISASSFSTYLIRNPQSLTGIDQTAIDSFAIVKGAGADAKLMIQDYVSEIATAGELSIMVVDGEITHAVRKIPQKGDFRSQAELGGAEVFLKPEEIDQDAVRIAARIWKFVKEKFDSSGGDQLLYARIDGVVRDDGKFVLMEAEFIEPWMYMNIPHAQQGLERFCGKLLSS